MEQNTEKFEEIIACLKLIHWHGASTRHKLFALSQLKGFQHAIKLNHSDWEMLLNRKLSTKKLPKDEYVGKDLHWLNSDNHHFLTFTDKRYPQNLKALQDAPLGLFVRGSVEVLQTIQIAIVGSRQQTPMGKKITTNFTKDLVNAGITITSGLAKGIDASAHQACCISQGQTIAVSGCGLDTVYPKQHEKLAISVETNGCLISEFPIGTPPKREHFPARNRIIAGLSEGVLVIEAAKRSGSLITARLAVEQGKEVFAVPGSILSPQSSGCHWLIQQGAVLAQSVDDILFELKLPLLQRIDSFALSSRKLATESVDENCEVLAAVSYDATSIDELTLQTKIDFQTLSQRLIELELDGSIARTHNGDYFRLT